MACGKRGLRCDAVLENGGDLFRHYFKCLIFHNFWKIRYSSEVFPTWNKLQTSIIIGFWEKWRKIKHTDGVFHSPPLSTRLSLPSQSSLSVSLYCSGKLYTSMMVRCRKYTWILKRKAIRRQRQYWRSHQSYWKFHRHFSRRLNRCEEISRFLTWKRAQAFQYISLT